MTSSIDPRIDYYKALGVSEQASPDEIKQAYRRLAKQYHPDRTGGDKQKEARFKEVSEAYDVLGDLEKRKQYDALRSGDFGGFESMPGGFNGFGDIGGIGDLFSQMFGRAGNVRSGPGGFHFEFSRGGAPDSFFSGAPPDSRRRARARAPRPEPRPRDTERKFRLADGTPAVQRGMDVYSDVRLAVDRAILGTVVTIATLEGEAKVKVPPGTSSGRKLRIKGKGVRKGSSVGDHYVTVHIDVPKNLDEKAKKLLIQLMQRVKKT